MQRTAKSDLPPVSSGGVFFNKTAPWVGACLLLVWLVCLAIALTVWFRPLYYWDMKHLDIPARAGLEADVVRANYDVLIDYNLIGGPETLEFPDFGMSQQGRIHFQEVKRIFVAAQWVALVGTVVLAGGAVWLWRRMKDAGGPGNGAEAAARIAVLALRRAGLLALVLVAAVGGLVAVSWDTAFVLMHKVLFRNDFWIFDYRTDPVITILPDTFFLHCGLMILLLVALGILLFRLLARYLTARIRAAGLLS